MLIGTDSCSFLVQPPTQSRSVFWSCFSFVSQNKTTKGCIGRFTQPQLHLLCGAGTQCNPFLTTVQPGRSIRAYCISFLDQVFSEGNLMWVGRIVRTKALTQINAGVYKRTRTSVHIVKNYSASHSSASSTHWKISGFPHAH